jgi:hypothetical protein
MPSPGLAACLWMRRPTTTIYAEVVMGNADTAGLVHLDSRELATIVGGAMGDGGEALAVDLGRLIGGFLGGCWCVLTHPPEASYSYAKVGY